MYAQINERPSSYTVCTPVKEDDSPDRPGLQLGTLAGGWYMRGRLVGAPPQIHERITDGMAELHAMLSADDARPLVEFYRLHDLI